MKIKIYSDAYNIAKRVKEIDKNYYLVFDASKNKFEVHNSNQIGSSYCLTLPYIELDERSLNYINKTRSTNIESILKEIENDNKSLESTEKNSAFSSICERMEDI